MAHTPHYVKGEWKVLCDSCGKEFLASELRQRWDGFMVCTRDWEPRQPQDFVRGVADQQAVPWSRPEPSDVFIPVYSRCAVAGICAAGIAVTGVPSYV